MRTRTPATNELSHVIRVPASRLRRPLFFLLVAATTGYGVSMMFDILRANGLTPLELAILVLFAVTFAWIAVALCTAVIGFVLQLFRLDPLSLRRNAALGPEGAPLSGRTAVVMPAYNEDPARVIAGLEAVYRDLLATGESASFHFYLLSDTTDAGIAQQEEAAWAALRRRVPEPHRLFYRRRRQNVGRKAGNIADFCRRWGAYYKYMVVLDADSLMTGTALVTLVRSMQANPTAGLIQTVPIPVRQHTVFGRFVQFAASLYSPMLATGLSFWQTDTANYWGHNAIIRMQAFMEHCGLPSLSGTPPLGGEILSHDFVEAALIRRGGWNAYLLADLEGSYEEVPANILDFATRDRRWAQGNMQHLRLLGAHGLHPLNRVHFLLGAVAYASSLLWLMMLVLSSIDAVSRALTVARYFGSSYQLFPDWPITKPDEVLVLLGIVGAMLVVPKVMGVLLCLGDRERRRAYGGASRLVLSATTELLFSVLIAPVMMTYHAYFVTSILMGRKVGWNPQSREGRSIGWREALRATAVATVAAVIWGAGLAYTTPIFFWALTPVLLGLVLAAPLIAWSSRTSLGIRLRRAGIFLTPAESRPDPVLQGLESAAERGHIASVVRAQSAIDPQDHWLPERVRAMPTQSFSSGPRWNGVPAWRRRAESTA